MRRILEEVEEECGWMYETQHVPTSGPSQEGRGVQTDYLGKEEKQVGTISYGLVRCVFVPLLQARVWILGYSS